MGKLFFVNFSNLPTISKFSTNNVVCFNAEWKTEPKEYIGWIESIKTTKNKTFQYFIKDAYDMLWCIPEQCIELISETTQTFVDGIDTTLKYDRMHCFGLLNDKPKYDLYTRLNKLDV